MQMLHHKWPNEHSWISLQLSTLYYYSKLSLRSTLSLSFVISQQINAPTIIINLLINYHLIFLLLPVHVKQPRNLIKEENLTTLSLINKRRINFTSLYVNVVISDLVFFTFLFMVDVRNELPLCLFISHPQLRIYSDCATQFILQQSDGATRPTQCNRVWFISGSWCFLVTAWSVVH